MDVSATSNVALISFLHNELIMYKVQYEGENAMDLLSKYAILEHIRYEMESELGKRVFIIPNVQGMPDMKNVLCLSDTSLEIWEMIVCGCNCVQIMKEICLKYVVKEEDIQGDVIEFLGGLIDKGYIAVLQEENEI